MTLTLARRELRSFMVSPLTYLMMGIYVFVMGWTFYNSLIFLQNEPHASFDEQVLAPLYGNMAFIFLVMTPVLTMKSFADEYRQNTFNLLLNSRLTFMQIIMGKFLALSCLVAFFFLVSFLFPAILWVEGLIDQRIIWTGMLGTFFTVLCFISLGLFISSLTDNLVLAALGTFFILLMALLLAQSAYFVDNTFVAQLVGFLSPPTHLVSFTRGMIQSYDCSYFISWVAFFLASTQLSLEVRYW